jgi:proteasome accessory factor A
LARLHVIFFDPTLCQVATLLRAGTLQIVTAMIEAGFVSPVLALDDPLEALQRWGHDPSLTARARMVEGGHLTAVELQQRFLEEARRFHDEHGFDGIVPRAAQILDLWEDTLTKLRERDFDTLGRRLDWVLKRQMLERAMAARPSLGWASHEVRHLDQMYASVDDGDGLFWAFERAGLVDTVIGEDQIERAVREPPDDTRAWTRAHLLRRAGTGRAERVDWNLVGVRVHGRSPHWWTERRTVYLARPDRATRAEHEALFAGDRPVEEIVSALQPESEPVVAALPTRYLC